MRRVVNWAAGGILAAALFAVGGGKSARGATPMLVGDEEWLGLYMLGQKVGYSHFKIEPGSGAFGDHIVDETVLRISLLGQSMEQKVSYTQDAAPDGRPLRIHMTMSSAGHETRIDASYGAKAVHAVLHSGGSATEKDIPIPPGIKLDIDPDVLTKTVMPMGKSVELYFFDPANLSIEKATIEVLRQEPLTLGGITYTATVVQTRMPTMQMTEWQDKDGHTLKAQSILGLTMTRETREAALSLPDVKYAPPADLGLASSVKPDRDLEDPRNATYLKIRLSAPSLPNFVSDDRQQVRRIDDDDEELTVSTTTLDPKGTLSLAEAARKEPEWVKPGPYLPSDQPEIKALAAKIVKGEKNAFWASQKLRDWVHQNMGVRADIGIIRSGLDIYKDREGVCRDFAVFYTTLARAAGLPTRIATGLVYSQGAFYYHAWAESYVGHWIDIDTTLPYAFVDATHLKLAHGAAETMFSAGGVMGNLKIGVLDYRTGDAGESPTHAGETPLRPAPLPAPSS